MNPRLRRCLRRIGASDAQIARYGTWLCRHRVADRFADHADFDVRCRANRVARFCREARMSIVREARA